MQGKSAGAGPSPSERADAEQQIVEQSKRIEFYITEYSVELLANKMRAEEYVVPDYQRNFTWEDDRQSKFIESLIMGLPIPFIFLWEMPDGRLEIVDGSQRLRTIEAFLLDDLRLGTLEQLPLISGFTFKDLPESRQRKIKNRSIRGIVLNEHADELARLDMFERINTGSKSANPAEIRRGALSGLFMDLVIELSGDAEFVKLAPMSKKAKDERGYEELVSRFFAYGDGYRNDFADYHDRPKEFIFEHTKKMNEALAVNPGLSDEYRRRFSETMSFIRRVFPHGFSKAPTGRATPRARFEAIAVGAHQALLERPELATIDANKLNVESWLYSDDFVDVTGSDGANAKERLRSRTGFVYKRLVNS